MNTIKFSHDYPKLWGQKKAFLIHMGVIEADYFPLPTDLIEYDTKTKEGEYYPLPKGQYLQLIFLGDKRIPFCTIRRRTPEKERYYRSKMNEVFEIQIKKVLEKEN